MNKVSWIQYNVNQSVSKVSPKGGSRILKTCACALGRGGGFLVPVK